ncbi:MAG: sulfotransferase [Methylobacter sp.]|nr:MAG: sulfotransferase [Methylobacter sp.]
MNGFFWIASYPKSGNTWLRLFLESLAAGGKPVDINALSICGNAAVRDAFDRILDMASADLTDDEITCARPRQYEIEARHAAAPQLRKVHDSWRMTPAGEALFPLALTQAAVYIVRDPRDVAVSLAHHMNQTIDQTITRMNNPLSIMEAARRRIPRQLPQFLGSWSQHVESWLDAPVKVLPVTYEAMLSEPTTTFGEIARFLGFETTSGALETAIKAVSFERLRASEEANGFVEKQPVTDCFFRRGIAGGWRDSLSSAQIARIETDHGPMMRRLGYL